MASLTMIVTVTTMQLVMMMRLMVMQKMTLTWKAKMVRAKTMTVVSPAAMMTASVS